MCKRALLLFFPFTTLLMAGCGMTVGIPEAPVADTKLVAKTGLVRSGQLPLRGASVQMYQAGTSGNGQGATGLVAGGGVTTDQNGAFDLAGKYHCDPGSQVYLVALGGNTGAGTNNAAALMTGLGSCDNLNANTSVFVNEVTTVATVWALAPFMSATPASGVLVNETGGVDANGLNIGAPGENHLGLQNAFADIGVLVNATTGTAPGTVPPGAIAPTQALNTIADILAACVASTDSRNGFCGVLFGLSSSPTGSVPANTISSALNIARTPALHVAALQALVSAASPFQPLSTSLDDFTLGVKFSGAGINAPSALAIDASGNVWISNSAANSVTKLSHTGQPLSGEGYFASSLSEPVAIALDQSGNAWVANAGNASITALSPGGAELSGSPFRGGGLTMPASMAFDVLGNLWIANRTTGAAAEFSSDGVPLSPSTGFVVSDSASLLGLAVSPR